MELTELALKGGKGEVDAEGGSSEGETLGQTDPGLAGDA